MAVNLSIKNVPDALAERLRARAERNHRSLQGELMAIVEQAALDAEQPDPAGLRWAERGVVGAGVRTGTRSIDEVYAELKARFPKPVGSGPLAVDIVRADRDSR